MSDEQLTYNNKQEQDIMQKISKFTIPQEGMYQLVLPAISILVYVLLWLVKLYDIGKNLIFAILLDIVLLAILFVIVFPLIMYCKKLICEADKTIALFSLENEKSFNEDMIHKCQECINVKTGNILNAYNIYTYDQILQIERKVGDSNVKNRIVFAYSMYRDDGSDVGMPEAEKVVENNINKGVHYYELFYNDPQVLAETDKRDFINLFTLLGEETANVCLDYQFYKDSRFGIMIYECDSIIEGYYCINFPSMTYCAQSSSCRVNCTLANDNRTENLIYKKMPRSIVIDMNARMHQLVKLRLRNMSTGVNNE